MYQNGLIKKIRSDNEIWSVNRMQECKMRNIFLEKSYIKWGGETSPRTFSEKLNLRISLDQQSKDFYSLLLLCGKLRAIEIYRN